MNISAIEKVRKHLMQCLESYCLALDIPTPLMKGIVFIQFKYSSFSLRPLEIMCMWLTAKKINRADEPLYYNLVE